MLSVSTVAEPLRGRLRTLTVRSSFSGSSSLSRTVTVTDSSSRVVAVSSVGSGASFTSVTVISTKVLSKALEGSVAVTRHRCRSWMPASSWSSTAAAADADLPRGTVDGEGVRCRRRRSS